MPKLLLTFSRKQTEGKDLEPQKSNLMPKGPSRPAMNGSKRAYVTAAAGRATGHSAPQPASDQTPRPAPDPIGRDVRPKQCLHLGPPKGPSNNATARPAASDGRSQQALDQTPKPAPSRKRKAPHADKDPDQTPRPAPESLDHDGRPKKRLHLTASNITPKDSVEDAARRAAGSATSQQSSKKSAKPATSRKRRAPQPDSDSSAPKKVKVSQEKGVQASSSTRPDTSQPESTPSAQTMAPTAQAEEEVKWVKWHFCNMLAPFAGNSWKPKPTRLFKEWSKTQ